jgi:hypothetical protein
MVSDQKYPTECLAKRHDLAFIQKGNDNLGYLLGVLCLWSQARPRELPLAAIIGDVILLSPPIVNVLLKL